MLKLKKLFHINNYITFLKKKKFKKKLLKFENIKIIYKTPKFEFWGITDQGVKKCLIKKVIDLEILVDCFGGKKLISYEESKLIKNVSVEVKKNRKEKQKQRHLELTKERQKLMLSSATEYSIIYITPSNQYWGIIPDTGFKKCLLKNIGDKTMLDTFLSDKKIITYKESKLYKYKQEPFDPRKALAQVHQAFENLMKEAIEHNRKQLEVPKSN